MRKITLSFLIVLMTVAVFGQAKKPILMIFPSDSYCTRNGCTQDFTDESGKTSSISDFSKVFNQTNSEELRLVISELSTIMADREFPLKDLEQTLKTIQQTNTELSLLQSSSSGSSILESPIDIIKRTAKADIILDLDFSVKKRGPQHYISFNLRGIDAYTGKVITAVAGDGQPSSAATVGLLLEEAVLNYMDDFTNALQNYFNDLFENGREIVVSLHVWDNADVNFETDFEYMGETGMLGDIMDVWMDDNCINSRFSRVSATENSIRYEQVRIPMFKTSFGKERAIDAHGFINGLKNFLKNEPFNIESKIYERGLGEVWLILGEK